MDRMIQIIVSGSDWQDVLSNLVLEHGLDPSSVDIVALADAFMAWLRAKPDWDFRLLGRFVLIAAILLSMKAAALLEAEEARVAETKVASVPDLSAPLLSLPAIRQPLRKVSLTELIAALNAALEIKRRKEPLLRRPVRPVLSIAEPEDIEETIEVLYGRIRKAGAIAFSDLVPRWRRDAIIATFTPLLHLVQRGKVVCSQPEPFDEIMIKLK